MKKTLSIICLLLLVNTIKAQYLCKHNVNAINNPIVLELGANSDSLDILHYTISLEIIDFSNQTISGNTEIEFTPLANNVNEIRLELLMLNVDSVIYNSQSIPFTYNDTILDVSFPTAINIGDTQSVKVYYNGAPVQDSQGQGGFYFTPSYAYNIGVALNDIPHNSGKVWFPCFDNFTDRASYSFYVKTAGGKKAHCNGYLVSEQTISGDTIVRNWEIDEEIPTYLACVAVSNYETVFQMHNGNSGLIPIELVALAGDTSDLKTSFQNLGNAIDIYEAKYGDYQWNKIGYSLVPFQYGAMEHATNVAYQSLLVNGATTYETVMAHELAHSWWGNLVTCEKAEEMWLNEGWASYSEHIFLEDLYGKTTYWDAVLPNQLTVLQDAHRLEEGYHSLQNVPLNQTYGIHTYQKGAMVIHNLRTYMGDSLFFQGVKAFIDSNRFKHINSVMLRDFLTSNTGFDVTDFFDGWVMNPGFPNFQIDSFVSAQSGSNYDIDVVVKQNLQSAPSFFNGVPQEISFLGANFEIYDTSIVLSGERSNFIFTIPFNPVTVYLNKDNMVLSATTANEKMINSTGLKNFSRAKMSVRVNNIVDSTWMRIERNWVAPDASNIQEGLRLSTSHSWSVKGNIKLGDRFVGNILYADVFDEDLTKFNEDSLVVAYREDGNMKWKVYDKTTKDINTSTTDGYGTFTIDSLIQGEYCLANSTLAFSSVHDDLIENKIAIYPSVLRNNDKVFISGLDMKSVYSLVITNTKGQIIVSQQLKNIKSYKAEISFNSGLYFLNLYTGSNKVVKTKKLTIVE